ncbi:hypothetical protein Q8A67_021911 [Cirrhinus molitorella]|uniref:Uncharacterized protein n=1 Tax=Cirrhinus molitorella TaxID=172907 RepID=A0AA88P6M2_9TELE|nr:hypothetical protein Q8A67_021911 [Cirrhinus molitorella]
MQEETSAVIAQTLNPDVFRAADLDRSVAFSDPPSGQTLSRHVKLPGCSGRMEACLTLGSQVADSGCSVFSPAGLVAVCLSDEENKGSSWAEELSNLTCVSSGVSHEISGASQAMKLKVNALDRFYDEGMSSVICCQPLALNKSLKAQALLGWHPTDLAKAELPMKHRSSAHPYM